ncbi:MAG TPA: glycosyl transferase family 1, partial [Candidatus Limnocylindria bacterium]|nr:glycosyl transferase family 1 [Candidatus Limnocylindria bacterium]
GKAIVSTPYLHAQEVLDHGRGILVPFRDSAAIATAVNSVLSDPQKKLELETRAYEYGKQMAWPAIGRRVLAMMSDVLDHRAGAPLVTPPAAPEPPELEPDEQLVEESTPIA